MNLGPYERNCKAHWVDATDPCRTTFRSSFFPDDLDRLEWYINDAMARVPILGTAGPFQGHQRADPLYAGRQSADRADAGRAERL